MEEHRARLEAAVPDGHHGGIEADLLTRDAQAFHRLVGLEEPPAQEEEPPLQGRAVEVERLAMDEVLHRVSGHDVRVVAMRVGPRKGLAHDLHIDLRGQHILRPPDECQFSDPAQPMKRLRSRPVRRDLGLAVVGLQPQLCSSCVDSDVPGRHVRIAIGEPQPDGAVARDGDHIADGPDSFTLGIGALARLQQGQDLGARSTRHEDDETVPEARLVRVVGAFEGGRDPRPLPFRLGRCRLAVIALLHVREGRHRSRRCPDAGMRIDELELLIERHGQRQGHGPLEQPGPGAVRPTRGQPRDEPRSALEERGHELAEGRRRELVGLEGRAGGDRAALDALGHLSCPDTS